MQIAADVSRLDQARQPAAAVQPRRLQLATVLAQFGLDVCEPEQLIHLALLRARARAADRVVVHAVLGHVQSAPHSPLAQRRVVCARAGEMLQQVAQLGGLGDAQIDAHARVRARPRPGARGGADALDLLERAHALCQRSRARRRRDQVQVLDAVRLAPRRAGHEHLRARRATADQPRHQRLGSLERSRQQHTRGRALGDALLERAQDALLEPRAEPAHVAQALSERRLSQLLRRVDAQLRVQQARALGPEARQARDRHEARWELRAQLLGRGDRAGVGERNDLLLQGRADPRQFLRAPRERQLGHRGGRLAHGLRSRAIRHHAVHDRTVELIQVAELFQGVRDRGVGQLSCAHSLRLWATERPRGEATPDYAPSRPQDRGIDHLGYAVRCPASRG